jgi:DNA adenine methylase
MTARPFLKMVGGKTQLLEELDKYVPAMVNRYFEPFVGGGALFFHLSSSGRIRGDIVLADTNELLIKTYRAVQGDLPELMEWLRGHKSAYLETDNDDVRLRYYLTVRAAMSTLGPDANEAARVIFTNKTDFNGLFRVNKRGQFNVPHGRYKKPKILDEDNLRACSRALHGAYIWYKDFRETCKFASDGDFVYLDPPYVPSSKSSDFTSYTPARFTMTDQECLRDEAYRMWARGVRVVLSNADVPAVRELYKGWKIHRVEARRNVNRRASGRGPVGEVIITP